MRVRYVAALQDGGKVNSTVCMPFISTVFRLLQKCDAI